VFTSNLNFVPCLLATRRYHFQYPIANFVYSILQDHRYIVICTITDECYIDCKTYFQHYRKTVFCRVPESSPCALFRAHDEDILCRVSPEEHTANKKHTGNLTLRRVPRASTRQTLIFAVCQPVGTRRTWITCGAHPSAVRGPHGRYCLPCARARHTANSHLRRVPVG